MFGLVSLFLVLSARDIAVVCEVGNAQKKQNFVTFVSDTETISALSYQLIGIANRGFTTIPQGRYSIIAPNSYAVVGLSEIIVQPEQTQQITLVNQENNHLFIVIKGAK